jgi:hypothetical protein
MAAVANLKSSQLDVQPGQVTTTELTIINNGTIVEQFTILLLGDVAAWGSVEPPVVSLFPQGQQTVKIRFSPPRHHLTPSGPIDFGVKVIPSNEPEESIVEEGVVTVGSFTDVGAELVPRVSTGRLVGKQRLAVDSRGNVPVPVELAAFDAAEGMKFNIRPKRVVAAPGEARFARIRVRPRQRFFRGPPQQKPYKVQVAPEGEKPLVLDGSLTQKSVLPKWLLPLIALAALLVLLWFLVLRPIVKSTAVTANAAALAAQAADNKRLSAQLAATQATVAALSGAKPAAAAAATTSPPTTAAKAGSPAAASTSSTATSTTVAGSSSTAGGTTTTTAPKGVTPTTEPPPVVGPNDGRIALEGVVSGATGTNAISPLGKGATLAITDLVVQEESPGQPGTLFVQRLNASTGKATTLLQFPLPMVNQEDEQLHFNTPMLFTAGQALQVQLACNSDGGACSAGVYYIGPLTQPGGAPTTVPTVGTG